MKIALNYDPQTGMITDDVGTILFTYVGLENHAVEDNQNDVETLVKLKNAGFETEDMVELRRKGLI